MLRSTHFGIIGAPVKGSMSPRLFTAAYGGRYPYDLIEEDDFNKAWARFLAEYDGINITAPFKAQAAAAADIRSSEVVRIGAANLAVKTTEGIKAYNTDYEGVRRALQEILAAPLSFRPRAEGPRGEIFSGGDFSTSLEMTERDSLEMTERESFEMTKGALEMTRRALIVGCGGAGRAAAAAAVDLGFEVTLANRTPEKALAMASETALWRRAPLSFRPRAEGPRGEIFGGGDFSTTLEMTEGALEMTGGALEMTGGALEVSPKVVGLEDLRGAVRDADLIIYTVPFWIPELDSVKKEDWEGRVVLEANYKTPVLTGCGAEYVSGKSWLLHQADAGYELFTGEVPDLAAMKAVLP